MKKFEDITRPGHGEVSFGFIHTLGMEVVPELMAVVQKKYPNMEFSLTQATSLNLLKRLEEGAIDLCLSQEVESKIIDIEWIELWSEELFVIVPTNHPLASKETIALHEIKGEPFISIKKGNSLRHFIDKSIKGSWYYGKNNFCRRRDAYSSRVRRCRIRCVHHSKY